MIGNTNTKRIHHEGCRAVGMIAAEHRVDGASESRFWKLCKWCNAGGVESRARGIYEKAMNFGRGEKQMELEDFGIKDCEDPTFKKLFQQVGCLTCGSKDGQLKMMKHEGGVEVQGHEGTWWVYFECGECGYQTAWWKALKRLQVMEREKKVE